MRSSARPNTGFCRNCCRKKNYPGATASLNSAHSPPSFWAQSPPGSWRSISGDNHGRSGAILIVLAAVGLMISLGITRVPAADPHRKFHANFLKSLFSQMRSWRGDRPLILAMLGNTYFNFLGALLLLNVFFFGADVLKVSEAQIGWLNAALAVGIGLGSVTAGYLSGGKIEYGLVPLGAVGLSVACLTLAEPGLSLWPTMIRLALLGFAGGFFIVPVSALLQHRPDKSKKGEVLAAANLLSFVGVFLASGAHYLLAETAHLSPTQIFLFSSALTLAERCLRGHFAARLIDSLRFVGFDANDLQDSHYGPGQHSGERRRLIRLQPRVLCRCNAVAGFNRPAGAVHDF